MTLDSVDSAELVYWHRPFLIVLFLLSCALVFGMESEIGDIPYVERAVIKNSAIGVALFSFVGYFIFRGSKLTVVGFSQKFSMQAARSRDEGMRFVNELMRAKATEAEKNQVANKTKTAHSQLSTSMRPKIRRRCFRTYGLSCGLQSIRLK